VEGNFLAEIRNSYITMFFNISFLCLFEIKHEPETEIDQWMAGTFKWLFTNSHPKCGLLIEIA
jgi:hypothetical protein